MEILQEKAKGRKKAKGRVILQSILKTNLLGESSLQDRNMFLEGFNADDVNHCSSTIISPLFGVFLATNPNLSFNPNGE